MGRKGCRIAVIGAGFSGALVTLHLLWRCGRDDRIYLVERACGSAGAWPMRPATRGIC